ncbi:hypothetical protein FQR65_LT03225 [Abscondita terminalis]|nr:hypothetical protein FQR65_LT03225 [Abscondita terminalis]
MSSSKDMEEYYQKVIHLQEKLRRSEEERLQLEMKYNEMIQTIKEEEEAHLKKIRSKYKQFLEEDRRRQQRNDKILDALERIENRSMMWEAKTKKFKSFRNRFQHHLKPDGDDDDHGDVINKYLQSVSSKPEDRYSKLGNINSIYSNKPARDLQKNNEQNYDSSKTSKDFQNSLKQSIKPVVASDCTQFENDNTTHDELKRLLLEEDSTQFREKKITDSDEEVGMNKKIRGIQKHASLRSKHENIDLRKPEGKHPRFDDDRSCQDERFVDEVALINSSYVVPVDETHDQDEKNKELKSVTEDYSVAVQDGSNNDDDDVDEPVPVGGSPEFPRCGSLLSVSPSQVSDNQSTRTEDQPNNPDVVENLLHLSEVPVYRTEVSENTFATVSQPIENCESVDEQGGEGCDANESNHQESQESFIHQPCDPNPQVGYQCDPEPQADYPCDSTPQPCEIQYDCNGAPVDAYNCEAYMQYNQQNPYYAEDYSAQPNDYPQYDETAQPYDENGQPYQYYDNTVQYDEHGEVIPQAGEENLQYGENAQYEDYGQYGQCEQYAENAQYAENQEFDQKCSETGMQPGLSVSPVKDKITSEPPCEETTPYQEFSNCENQQYGVNESFDQNCLESDGAQPTSVASPKKNKKPKSEDLEPSCEDESKKSQIPANASKIVENNECGCDNDYGRDEEYEAYKCHECEYCQIQYHCNCGYVQCNCDAYMQNFYYADYSQYEGGQSYQYYYDQYTENYGQYEQYEEYEPICESCHQYEREEEFDSTRIESYSAYPTTEKKTSEPPCDDVVTFHDQMSEPCECSEFNQSQPPSATDLKKIPDTVRFASTKKDNKKMKKSGENLLPCDDYQDTNFPHESCECSESYQSPPSATNLKKEPGRTQKPNKKKKKSEKNSPPCDDGKNISYECLPISEACHCSESEQPTTDTNLNKQRDRTKKANKRKEKSRKKSPLCDDRQDKNMSYECLSVSESCGCTESDQSQPPSVTNLNREPGRTQKPNTKTKKSENNLLLCEDDRDKNIFYERLPISESCECSEFKKSTTTTNLKKEQDRKTNERKKKFGKNSLSDDDGQHKNISYECLSDSESCECSESDQSQPHSTMNLKKKPTWTQKFNKKKKQLGNKSPLSESCECSESDQSQPSSARNLKKESDGKKHTNKKVKKARKNPPPCDNDQAKNPSYECLPVYESCGYSESELPTSATNLKKEPDSTKEGSKRKEKSGQKSPLCDDDRDKNISYECMPVSESCECGEYDQSQPPSATNLKEEPDRKQKPNRKEKMFEKNSPPYDDDQYKNISYECLPISESWECAEDCSDKSISTTISKKESDSAGSNSIIKLKKKSGKKLPPYDDDQHNISYEQLPISECCECGENHSYNQPQPNAVCSKTDHRSKNEEFHQKCFELTESHCIQSTDPNKDRNDKSVRYEINKDKKLDEDCLNFVLPNNSTIGPKKDKKEEKKKFGNKKSAPCDDDHVDDSHKQPITPKNAKKKSQEASNEDIISQPTYCPKTDHRRKHEEFHRKCFELTESNSLQRTNPNKDGKDKIHFVIKDQKELNQDYLQFVVPKNSATIPRKYKNEDKNLPLYDNDQDNERLPVSESCECKKPLKPTAVTTARKESYEDIISQPFSYKSDHPRKNEELNQIFLQLTESHSFQQTDPKKDKKDKVQSTEMKGEKIDQPKNPQPNSDTASKKDKKEKKKWKWNNK